MARNPFENPVSLTAARKAYAMSLFDMCYARVARDLDNDTTTEGVAIPALAQIVAAYTPHAGKGHAEDTRLWVADQVAALRTPDAAQEAQAQEAQAQEAQAQEDRHHRHKRHRHRRHRHKRHRHTGTGGTGTGGTGTGGTGTGEEARPS
jgi:protein required for attachment to host cells